MMEDNDFDAVSQQLIKLYDDGSERRKRAIVDGLFTLVEEVQKKTPR